MRVRTAYNGIFCAPFVGLPINCRRISNTSFTVIVGFHSFVSTSTQGFPSGNWICGCQILVVNLTCIRPYTRQTADTAVNVLDSREFLDVTRAANCHVARLAASNCRRTHRRWFIRVSLAKSQLDTKQSTLIGQFTLPFAGGVSNVMILPETKFRRRSEVSELATLRMCTAADGTRTPNSPVPQSLPKSSSS